MTRRKAPVAARVLGVVAVAFSSGFGIGWFTNGQVVINSSNVTVTRQPVLECPQGWAEVTRGVVVGDGGPADSTPEFQYVACQKGSVLLRLGDQPRALDQKTGTFIEPWTLALEE